MKKTVYNRRGNMVIETGHKTFDRQTNYVGPGNVFANTMIGLYIRPFEKVDCNGFTFPQGHLFYTDMKTFNGLHVSNDIIKEIKQLATKHNGVIFYGFFHYNGKERIVDGFLVTDKEYNYIKTFFSNWTQKSFLVLQECRKYVSNN